ncbi:M1 family metallopeptidase [Actinacidiphila glaucinigra]|uniref:M1 family metallopeptidase n=1 Tax=Actinacidiphila glaucinigra TaxID=235986 RepID=UPI002E2F1A66|nr:M1 family metallopeptidase [Actinacidiphila glaucinigra]
MIGSFARRAGVTAAAVAALTAAGLPGDTTPVGLGDRLYPELGNPGYDVHDYDISFTYHGNDRPLDAVTRVDAFATDTLDRFHLDFRGDVRSVEVNGRRAAFRTWREELVVTPAVPVPRGDLLRVTVVHTSDPAAKGDTGWIRTKDGLAMANQAAAAHTVFPCNDHPSDKARFAFHVTAPNDLTVVANGLPETALRKGPVTTWNYRTVHVMATELAQVSVGRSTVLRRTGPGGLPLRDVVGTADPDRAKLEKRLALTAGQIAWMEEQVGPFPLETYGILSADTVTGFELETQTLSLFERRVLLSREADAAPVMVHELAHQWFGDSVSPATWSDLWLNEGHATWYQWRYAAEHYRELTLEQFAKAAYGADARLRRDGGPAAAPKPPGSDGKLGIFRGNVYFGGALVLYALRQEMGPDAFQRLERAWVARHRDGVASTGDFIALASDVAGRDLGGFLRAWLYGPTTPPMPGHPDWKRSVPAKPVHGHAHRREAGKVA